MAGGKQVSALGSVSFGWLHEQGGFVFDEAFFMDPRLRAQREREIHEFVAAHFSSEPIYNIEACLVQVEGRQRPVVLVGGLQPNLILGAAVGARFVFYGDKDPDITPTPLADLRGLDELRQIDWSDTWPVNLFLEQIQAASEQSGGDYVVVPPFFWDTTGRATTHGIVTTAQKLIGERIFLEMADDSPLVGELFSWIVDSYVTLIQLFADAAGMQITGLHTGECSSCMVSPRQFADQVLPHFNELADRVGPLRLHSCGASDHLLDVFQQVHRLASLNVGSGTSVAKIRERFGPLRVDLLPPAELLTAGTPEQVAAWVRQSVDENGDGRLEFQYHLDLGQPEANCLQIHRTLESLGLRDARTPIY